MSSTYAPLPFSYLAPGGANPRMGLRKDGVYGTSADVPRIYEEPATSSRGERTGTEFKDNPYNVYANASDTSAQLGRPGITGNYEAVYDRPTQTPQHQKPGGDYSHYHIPEADYVRSDRDLQREQRNPGRGYHEPDAHAPRQGRVQTYLPPGDAGRHTPDDKSSRVQNEPTPSAFDNFILVKDPNRTDQNTASDISSTDHDGGKTKLQTLFEDKGHTPRHNNISTQPPANETRNGDLAAKQNPSYETRFEEPNYSLYYGSNTTDRPMANGERPKESIRNHLADQTAHATKSGQPRECCRCSTCSAVVTAIIITAVICFGAGFVAGWFGAIADRDKSATVIPTSQSTVTFYGQTPDTTLAAVSKESTTSTSSTSTTKTTTTTTQPSSTATTTTASHSYSSSPAVSNTTASNATRAFQAG